MGFEDELKKPVALREYGVPTILLGDSAKKLVDKAIGRNLTPHAITFDYLDDEGDGWQVILWTD